MGIVVRILAAIVVLLVITAGGVYVASQQQPGIAKDLEPVPTSSAAAQSFDQKIADAKKAADEAKKTGKAQPVELTLTEEELTTKAATEAATATGGVTATNTQIHLQNGDIIATSTVTVSGINVNVGIVAEPTVVNGQTQIVVKEIQTGALPLPDAIKQQINDQIGSAIDPKKLGLPFDVSQLEIVDGKLVIKGTANP